MKKITFPGFGKVCFLTLSISAIFIFHAHAQTDWVRVPTPDVSATRNMLRGISGTSASDIWAVGSYEDVFTVPPYYRQNDLIMHWNGSDWSTYPALHLSNTLDDLWDVEAISTNNVWAVGIFNGASDPRAEILHFDGTQWTAQNPPAITGGSGLFSLDAVAANDIWAVGAKTGSPTRPCYVRHYNGSSWNEVIVPAVGAYRNEFAWVDAVSATDVWAGGFFGETTGDFHAMVMRWNGSTWQNVALPDNITTPQSEVLSVKAISSDDVWVVGYYLTGGGFKIHWDGGAWTQMPDPNGGGGAFAALSSDKVFSVGNQIWYWDGTSWTLNDPLAAVTYPSLVNTVTFPNGDIWACGVSTDTDNHFHTLVYRNGGALAVASFGKAAENYATLAPNPAQGRATIQLKQLDNIDFTITDALGKVLKNGTSSGSYTIALELSGYASGTYFIHIRGTAFTEVKKIVVSN